MSDTESKQFLGLFDKKKWRELLKKGAVISALGLVALGLIGLLF